MVVPIRSAIGSIPSAKRSGYVSINLPCGDRLRLRLIAGSSTSFSSTNVSSTQVSAGTHGLSGRYCSTFGIGVSGDSLCVVRSPSAFTATTQQSKSSAVSGSRCGRSISPVSAQMIALSNEVLPDPFLPSKSVGGAGDGSLLIAQGGRVNAVGIDEATAIGGDGVISVTGAGSALALTGNLTVGDQAAGEVSVLNGATLSALHVTVGKAAAGSSGNVDVEGTGSSLLIGIGGVLNIGVAGGGSGVLTIGPGTTLHSAAGIVEAGHASFNNNGGAVDPPFFQITTPSNAGLGSNSHDLY